MFRKKIKSLEDRIKLLEEKISNPDSDHKTTLRVPVIDENGDYVKVYSNSAYMMRPYKVQRYKDLSFAEVCKALQDMCGIEITYQETPDIPGKKGVVIYERDE